MVIIQHKQIQGFKRAVDKKLENYPTWEVMHQRARYVNYRLDELDFVFTNTQISEEIQEDYLYNLIYQESPDIWMVNLTTDQVDSVLCGYKEQPEGKMPTIKNMKVYTKLKQEGYVK